MTWEPMTFASTTHTGPAEVRIGIGRRAGGREVILVIPHAMAEQLAWKAAGTVAMAIGTGDDRGHMRIAASSGASARRLRTTSSSKNLRLVTPISGWPWLPADIPLTPLEACAEARVVSQAGRPVLEIRLPQWAYESRSPEAPPPAPRYVSPQRGFAIGASSAPIKPPGANRIPLGGSKNEAPRRAGGSLDQ